MAICRVCKQELNTKSSDCINPVRNFYYHKKCYEDWKKDKDKPTTELNAEQYLLALLDYLKYEARLKDMNYAKINTQWKSLLKKGYKPKGIYLTVRYFYEIKKGDGSKSNGGIGIVEYIYEESSIYWTNRVRNNAQIIEKINEQVQLAANRQTINVKKEKVKKKNNKSELDLIAEMEG